MLSTSTAPRRSRGASGSGVAAPGPALESGFLASAARYPTAPALAIGDRRWCYAEVERDARRWAGAVLEATGPAPERIGIFGSRGRAVCVGELASLLAGAAFVPINPTAPSARSRAILESADVDAILVDGRAPLESLATLLEGLARPPAVLLPEGRRPAATFGSEVVLDRDAILQTRELRDEPSPNAESLAYLLFTSGSTGEPKGVPITHANVTHCLEVNHERYRLSREDRLTQTFEPTFDLSVFDLFMAWGVAPVSIPWSRRHCSRQDPSCARTALRCGSPCLP